LPLPIQAANPFPPAQSLRPAYTGCGWQSMPPPDCA